MIRDRRREMGDDTEETRAAWSKLPYAGHRMACGPLDAKASKVNSLDLTGAGDTQD